MTALSARILVSASAFVAVALASPFSQAADDERPINENPLAAAAKFAPETVAPGSTTELRIEMDLAEGYHAYRDRFKVAFDAPDGMKVDVLRIEPLVQFKDAVTGEMKEGIERTGSLRATVEIPSIGTAGATTAQLRLTYQACTASHCLFPKTISLEAPLRVGSPADGYRTLGGPSLQPAPPTVEGAGGALDFQRALGRGLAPALAFVFLIGFLTSLTPCIYPMIPITLAILGARTQGQSQLRSFLLSATYVLGIAVTYSALGVAAASTGALFGAALSNVYVVTSIALVFLAMGLSMYGLYELQVPAFIRNRLGATQAQAGFFGAFATGLIAGIVASPCVGPVLVGVLAYIAQTQNRLLGFLFLFTFACGMGVLFMILGAFSQLTKKVPKSGPWMESIKFVFGTTMVGMALYYVKPLYPDWLFHALLALALIAISSAYGAFDANVKLRRLGRLRKGAMLTTFFVGSAFAIASAFQALGLIPKSGSVLSAAGGGESFPRLDWRPFSEDALARALAEKKPVIMDFNAEWCAACKELEKFTFADPRIRERSREFALFTIDATNSSKPLDELLKRFGVVGLPTLIFYDLQGRRRNDLTLTGFEEADHFLARMEKALQAP